MRKNENRHGQKKAGGKEQSPQAGEPSEEAKDRHAGDAPAGEAKPRDRHAATRDKRPVSAEHVDAPEGGADGGGGAVALQLLMLIVGSLLLVGGVAWWWRRSGMRGGLGAGGKVRAADEPTGGVGKARPGLGERRRRGKRIKGEESLSLSANVWTEEQDEQEEPDANAATERDEDGTAVDDDSSGDEDDDAGAREADYHVMEVRVQMPSNGALGLKLSSEAVVIGLLPGGAALRAGVRVDDLVEAVDGQTASGARVAQLLQAGAAKSARLLRVRRLAPPALLHPHPKYQEDL